MFTDKVISKKREDLDRILDHFNIQIENPIVVLNQEVSKNFLWSKGAGDRYKVCVARELSMCRNDVFSCHTDCALQSYKLDIWPMPVCFNDKQTLLIFSELLLRLPAQRK